MKSLQRHNGFGYLMLVAIVLLTCSTLFSQTATLQGRITDQETGETLPGANVTVTASGVQTGAAANTQGNYVVRNLPAGTYTVTASYIGYEDRVIKDVQLSEGESRTLDVSLLLTGVEFNPIAVSASRREEKTLESPASISVLEAREITQTVTSSSAEILKNVTGVDMATTGVDRREIVLRGFNNAFSGATYILTDYRKAAVPSLDVNIHSIMPNMAIDLERVEVVRGPGSALYGAGVDAGVIHYLTKGPFEYPGTTVSFTGGQRSSIATHFRHAQVLSPNVAFKFTGQYAQADDWEYDLDNRLDRAQLINPITDDTTRYNRDYEKANFNGQIQFRLDDNTTLTANGGYSALTASVLSGIGTVQADGYGYAYGQLRLQAGDFFAQAYLNKNNVGDSFVYGQQQASGERLDLTDNSTLLNLQAQYDFEIAEGREKLIVGVDYDRTTPQTGGTIYGRNEQNDLISEFGVYSQSKTQISSKLDFTAALRADYNNIEEDFQLSPRAALVYKPTPKHNFRATYNRAYALPGSNSLFLDIIGQEVPLTADMTIVQRGRGSVNGFSFDLARQSDGIHASGTLPINGIWGNTDLFVYPDAGVPVPNVPMAPVYGIIYSQVAQIPPATLVALLASQGIQIDQATAEFVVRHLSPVPDPDNDVPGTIVQGNARSELEFLPENVEPLKSTITHTMELGYKGLLGEKLLVAVDGYYTQKKNFVSGVTQLTPLARFSNITADLTPALTQAIENNPFLNVALDSAGLDASTVANILVGLAGGDLENLPVGVVQPDGEDNQVPGEITGGYRNFGNIDLWGIDASVQYLVNRKLSLFGNVSYVSDDFFDNDALGEDNPALFLALNSTQFKAKGGFSYSAPKGFSFNAAARYTQAFPVASGPYIGGLPFDQATKERLGLADDDVGGLDDYFLLDLGVGYDFSSYAPGLRIDVAVQNVLDNQHREFIGAPEIGRLALARVTYSR